MSYQCAFFKNIKIGEFLCSHFNIEDERKYATFLACSGYYFKKSKNATEMQKKICAVYREGSVTDRTCQKWFAKFCAGDFLLEDAMRLRFENNQCYIMWEILNILKIS